MGAKGSKPTSSIQIPDIDGMPSSERQKALEDLVVSVNRQTITFGFRKVEPDSRGDEILKSVAKGMTILPEYALRIEGHSNLAKSEKKLTAEDKARIQKLSENRAEACARFLKAAGVQNEITCVGQGALKGETKGCVRLVLVPKGTPPQVVPPSESSQEETQLPKKELDNIDSAIANDPTPEATTEEASITIVHGIDNQVLPERSRVEEDAKPSDAEETNAPIASESAAGIEIIISDQAPPDNVDSKDGAQQDLAMTQNEVAPAKSSPDEADQWGNTYLPWYITCCSQKARPKTDECPMQGLPVKQMQLLQ
jgi:hypothetical protein